MPLTPSPAETKACRDLAEDECHRGQGPSASDKAGQQTSAYDPALIGRSAMHLPDFRGYVMTTQAPFPEGRSADGKQTPALSISNHNTLFLNYPGAIGIKNGYTNAGEDGTSRRPRG